MIPADYDRELADTIYRDVEFYIEPDQFDEDSAVDESKIDIWYNDIHEAKEAAQAVADAIGSVVHIEVWGKWGHYGREYIDVLTMAPKAA